MATRQPVVTTNPEWGIPNSYNFGYPYRGFAIIISNETFRSPNGVSVRSGAKADARSMERLFRRFGFKVYIYMDLTAHQMDALCCSVASDQRNLLQSDCFALIISTHGEELPTGQRCRSTGATEHQHHLLGSDCNPVPTHSLVQYLAKSEALKNKPKLFFLQACSSRPNTAGYDPTFSIGLLTTQQSGQGSGDTGLEPSGGGQGHTHAEMATDTIMAAPDLGPTTSTISAVSGRVEFKWSLSTGGSVSDDEDITWDGEGATDPVGVEGYGGADDQDTKPFRHLFRKPNPDPYDILPAPCYKDCLVMFASPSGYYAMSRANPGTTGWSGGWLIRSMYDILKQYEMETEDFLSALVRVSEMMALHESYQTQTDNPDTAEKKTVPRIIHMLTKDIYFIPKHSGTTI